MKRLFTDEHRAKLSAAKIGKPGPKFWSGKRLSEKHRSKLSAAQKRRFAPGKAERDRLVGISMRPERRVAQREFAIQLAARPGRISGLEMDFASRLDSRGVKYTSQYRIGRFAYDFAILPRRILIEVDGCYWHGCVQCGYTGITKTVSLGALKDACAERNGWRLVRIKECVLRG